MRAAHIYTWFSFAHQLPGKYTQKISINYWQLKAGLKPNLEIIVTVRLWDFFSTDF